MNHHTPPGALRALRLLPLAIALGCWIAFSHMLGNSWHTIATSPWHSLVYDPLAALQAALRAIH